MTIQVAVMNGYGVALASDRHVYRDGEGRSTGQDRKLHRLRGPIPAAMMYAGPFAVFGVPVARLALRLERALAEAGGTGPDRLAASVLDALEAPLEGLSRDADTELLEEVAARVMERAAVMAGQADGDMSQGLVRVLAEIDRSPACRNREAAEAQGRAAWEANVPRLTARGTALAAAWRHAPELWSRAVASALSRAWRGVSDIYITVGLCCPATGVPVLIALRLWRGLAGRLHAVSRLEHDYEVSWRAGRTVVAAQGSGRGLIEAMIDGLGEDHWGRMAPSERAAHRGALDARWEHAHTRLGVSSTRELVAIATGLVRGAEVIGYLTRDGEGTLAPIDSLCLDPVGATEYPLAL